MTWAEVTFLSIVAVCITVVSVVRLLTTRPKD